MKYSKLKQSIKTISSDAFIYFKLLNVHVQFNNWSLKVDKRIYQFETGVI